MYLHELGDEKDSFTKEEMAAGYVITTLTSSRVFS
jgi:hypothetical protein